MKAIFRRVGKLEDRYHVQLPGKLEVLRLVVSIPWKTTPGISTCRRTLTTAGSVIELVNLHGADCNFRDEELDRFLAGFPILSASGAPG
jgi:hypothetical protein